MRRLAEAPWHQVFNAALRVSVEDGGELVDRVHVGHLAGGDQRGEHGPVLGAGFIPCK